MKKVKCPNCKEDWSKIATWAFETSHQQYHVLYAPTVINCTCGTQFPVYPDMKKRNGAIK